MQTKLICDFGGVHCILPIAVSALRSEHTAGVTAKTDRQVLFVGKDQQECISELILVQHSLELLAGLADTFPVVGVDHEDDALGVLEIMAPEGTNLVLSSNIPYGERDVLVLNSLNVET